MLAVAYVSHAGKKIYFSITDLDEWTSSYTSKLLQNIFNLLLFKTTTTNVNSVPG